jgi:tetrahydromethanopterin S-methyltransferase subunit F
VVPRAAFQWQLAERKARLMAGVISKGVMVFLWLW